MSIHNMIKTFFKTGYIVRPSPSPMIQALRNIERNDWQKKRQIAMIAIEIRYKKQGITPQQLTTKIREYGKDKFSRKDNITMGIWNYLNDELKAEEEYQKAIQAGATEIILPLEVGEQGYFSLECVCQMECQGQDGDRTLRIELTIFEHNVWKCPRCNKLWALRNMACVDTMEDEDETI